MFWQIILTLRYVKFGIPREKREMSRQIMKFFWLGGKLTRGHLARTLFVRVCVRLLFI